MYNWTTAQVKERAKNSFRTFGYWIPFLIMLILSFVPFYSDSSDSFVSLLFFIFTVGFCHIWLCLLRNIFSGRPFRNGRNRRLRHGRF